MGEEEESPWLFTWEEVLVEEPVLFCGVGVELLLVVELLD